MVYQRTPAVIARIENTRETILRAARDLVAEGGWQIAHVANVAQKAGVATGSVYRYFPSKAELFAEVLAKVSSGERDVLAAVAQSEGDPAARLKAAVSTFCLRALRGRRLAYAMIAEPCDREIDAARLVWRKAISIEFVMLIEAGQASNVFRRCDPNIAAACVVGAFMEALVGPLAPETDAGGREVLAEAIAEACLAIVVAPEAGH